MSRFSFNKYLSNQKKKHFWAENRSKGAVFFKKFKSATFNHFSSLSSFKVVTHVNKEQSLK